MKNVSIGGIPYEFYLIPEIMPEDEINAERIGEADNREYVIRVTNQGPPELVEQTFFHELLHAIAHIYRIAELNRPTDEHIDDVIDLLALGLVNALRSVGVHVSDFMEEEDG